MPRLSQAWVMLHRVPPDMRIFTPGLRFFSSRTTRRSSSAAAMAAISPAAPAPTTAMSTGVSDMRAFSQEGERSQDQRIPARQVRFGLVCAPRSRSEILRQSPERLAELGGGLEALVAVAFDPFEQELD